MVLLNKLNEEQKVITNYVLTGMTNAQIGLELGYSECTIKKRLTKIYKLLNISGRLELVRTFMC